MKTQRFPTSEPPKKRQSCRRIAHSMLVLAEALTMQDDLSIFVFIMIIVVRQQTSNKIYSGNFLTLLHHSIEKNNS
jgi:hypothetical protein